MAASPDFKVYTPEGEYIAATKYPEEAAAVVALRGIPGTTIRYKHRRIVWTEGTDGVAGDSFDVCSETVWSRVEGRNAS